jgi:hypothetical protein
MHGRNIGPPMDPPYINYNGVYGQFDHLNLEPILWLMTSAVNKEMLWNPYMSGEFKDPNIKLTALKIKNNDVITLTPLGKAKVESEIKKYNVVITYM